jgi:transglutaminase-like putative cysteine protease
MIYSVSHRTTYRYGEAVSISHHMLHLLPRTAGNQICHRTALFVNPTPTVSASTGDYFGNRVNFLTIQMQHVNLTIHSKSVVELNPAVRPVAHSTPPWETVRNQLPYDNSAEGIDALQYVFSSPFTFAVSDLAAYAAQSFQPGRATLDGALDLTARIFREFKYDSTATTVSTPVDTVVKGRRGVCQDFAHLEIACLRALGLAARYVSGYLLTWPAPGQQKMIGSDASHAWLSIWIPGHGWLDLDPTNNLMPSTEHITIGWGRDYGDVSPINGVIIGGGAHDVTVAVDVSPVDLAEAMEEREADSPVIQYLHGS